MGGLAGLVSFDGASPERTAVEAMAALLAHRGPDGAGTFADDRAAFAHRLRRIGAGSKVQPCVAPDLVVLLDGWIYEHRVLAQTVGDCPPDATDTEVLLGAWRKWGLDALDHLDGEFAFAVWDRRSRTLALVRDRLGVRPLYWWLQRGQLAFASELPALLAAPWIERELASEHLAEYLSFQVVHAPRTLLRHVHQVEPACAVLVVDGVARTRRYWTLRYAPDGARGPREADAVEALHGAVAAAVGARIPAGIATGLYLSGGLGSAAIAAAARDRHALLPGFTVALAEDPFPEAPFAARVARLLGLEHHDVVVSSAELAARFDQTVRTLGHPIGHPSAVLQLALAHAARARVRTVLSGDGSEELFGGRMLDAFGRAFDAARLFAQVPAQARRPLSGLLSHWGPTRRATGSLDTWVLDHEIGGANLFSVQERARLLQDPTLVRPQVRREVLESFYAGLATDPVNTALHGWLRSNLGETALPHADRTAAAAGLDIRFPLLDRRVVEAAAALPGRMKRRRAGVHTRWLLRALLSGVLPAGLTDRPKRGLPVPLGGWLAGPGRLFLEDRIARLGAAPHGLFRPEALGALRRDVTRSNAAGNRLWTLFALDAWLAQSLPAGR